MSIDIINVPAAPETVPWLLMGLILFGSAVLSWGLTEAVKATVLARLKYAEHVDTREAKRRMWWSPLLVVVAMAFGAGVGALVGGIEWTTGYGATIGAMGGALATFLVSLFKGNLQAMINKLTGNEEVLEKQDDT